MKRLLMFLTLALIVLGGLSPTVAGAQSLGRSPGIGSKQAAAFAGTGLPARLSSRSGSAEVSADKPTAAGSEASSANETYKNLATSLCLNAHYNWSVDTYGCSSQYIGEYWTVVANSDGTRTFRNAGVGGCLDSNTSGKVYLLGCNGGSFQKWIILHDYSRGTITFKNLATSMCLDSNSSKQAYTLGCNGGSYQKWY
jgi:serine/threonine-protein kinase